MTAADCLARLKAMIADEDGTTWDLSPNDTGSLRWAVAELTRLTAALTTAHCELRAVTLRRDEAEREGRRLRAEVEGLRIMRDYHD